MKLTMMLCDAAQAVNGKLYILGGGWNLIGPDPAPSAIALHIDVPWDETNQRHNLRLALVTDDGRPVMVQTATGPRPTQIDAGFEVGRPPGVRAGSSLPIVLAINIAALPLPPDSGFEWRCDIDDQTRDDWRLPFSTRPAPDTQAPPREG